MKVSCKSICNAVLKDCMIYMADYYSAGILAGTAFACLYCFASLYLGGFAGQTVRRKSNTAKVCFKSLSAFLLGFYLYLVLGITILSREKSAAYIMRPVPLTTWGTDLWHLTLWAENILLMIPLGILLYILWAPFRKIGWSMAAGFLFSFTIECIQLFTRLGKFETDDMINNVSGTLIGFLIGKGLGRAAALSLRLSRQG